MGPGETVAVVLPAAGGTVEVLGLQLTVPPGSTGGADQAVNITRTPGAAVAGFAVYSPVYRFEPEGLRFDPPLRVRLPFEGPRQAARLFWSRRAAPGYEARPALLEGAALVGEVGHFSEGFVGQREAAALEDLPIECLTVHLGAPRAYPPAAVRASFEVRHCTGEPLVRPLDPGDVEVINRETGRAFDGAPGGGGASAPARLADLRARPPGSGGAPTVARFALLSLDFSSSMVESGAVEGVLAAAQAFVDAVVRDADAAARPQVAIQVFGRTDATRMVQDFTADHARLTAALAGLRDTPGLGNPNLYGAYEAALGQLEAQAASAEVVGRALLVVTDGRHEAGDFDNQRAAALARRDAAIAAGVEVFSVAVASPDADLPLLSELASAPSLFAAVPAAAAVQVPFARAAEQLLRRAEATYVVGICTPVELGQPGIEVAVTVDGVRAVGAGTYDAAALTGDVGACDLVRVAEPCGAAVCGPSALPGLSCGQCGPEETCTAQGQCACIEGGREAGACGLNGRGARARVCTGGAWGEWTECVDADVCVDFTAEVVGACGDGSEARRRCALGRWRAENCPCAAGDLTPPCNGCPEGTVVPAGFVCAPAGSFTQGEVPLGGPREVTLSRPFVIQRTEVTQQEWQRLMGNNPSRLQACGDTCPVEQVSWLDAVAFANMWSAAQGLAPCYDAEGAVVGGATPYDCDGYRLPMEAEWEYACRAGTQTVFYWGDSEADADAHAWYRANAGDTTHPVSMKRPNAWGLHDMAGNVLEWVNDGLLAYPQGPAFDPWAEQVIDFRTARGGSWRGTINDLRAATRAGAPPDRQDRIIGVRLARTLVP